MTKSGAICGRGIVVVWGRIGGQWVRVDDSHGGADVVINLCVMHFVGKCKSELKQMCCVPTHPLCCARGMQSME